MDKQAVVTPSVSILKEYEAPDCEIFSMGVRSVICESETERVGEQEGEW